MASKEGETVPLGEISLRPASPADNEFLVHAYASTRQDEMESWGWNSAQQASFVEMQFAARRRGYAAEYPSAEICIICVGESRAGSIIISRRQSEIRLVDITLLPEFRSRGIGGHLIGTLIHDAARSRSALRLNVLHGNRARRLYERLGFVREGGDSMYCQMEWKAADQDQSVAGVPLESDPNAGPFE